MTGVNATASRKSSGRRNGSVGVWLLSALVREPGGGEQLGDPAVRPAGGDLAEDVAQVLERRRVGKITGDDERLQDRQALAALVAACEQKILPSNRSTALLTLDVGVRQRHAWVVEKHDQGRPLIDGVGDGLAERALGHNASVQVSDDRVEPVDDRPTMRATTEGEVVEASARQSSAVLDGVEVAHQRDDDGSAHVAGLECVYPPSAAVVHAPGAARRVGAGEQGVEAGVAVGLDDLAGELREHLARSVAFPVGRELAEADALAVAEEGPDVPTLDPFWGDRDRAQASRYRRR